MKSYQLLFLLPILWLGKLHAQQTYSTNDLIGAWETNFSLDDGQKIYSIAIIGDGFYSSVFLNQEDQAFLSTQGGALQIVGNMLSVKYEFHTGMPERIGQGQKFEIISIKDGVLTLDEDGGTWNRLDDGTPGELSGAWLFGGRKRDGEIQRRDTSGSRKTMKILSGTRFQWIAYDIKSKKFMGTGGGTYTTKDGKYIEKIGFFSKDPSRVGAELPFEFELVNGEWHHQGLSSKGQPIYEVWTLRK